MLKVERLTRRFGEFVAVDAIDLDIPAGEMIGIIGRSGAGKSTLLRMIDRLIEPSTGTIRFEGRNVTALRGAALRHWRRDCAMVFQQFALVDRLDVLTNVLMGRLDHMADWRAMLKLWSADDKAIALSALELFDMGALAANRAGTLSGGQQQRVAIARALVQEPRVILADEPIASLDPRNTRLVMDALLRVNRDFGITVLTNVLIGRLNHVSTPRALLRLWSEEDRAMALSALEMFGIAELAAKRADQLSGGQQQRVAIARALVQEPEIVLADEPIASLDPRNTKIVMDALLRINRHFGITVLCNLHSIDLARSYCDRLIGMSAGRVVFDGAAATLTDDVARELYGLEAGEVMDPAHAAAPVPGHAGLQESAVPA